MSIYPSTTCPVGTMYPGYVSKALLPYLIRRLRKVGICAAVVVEADTDSMFLLVNDVFRSNLSPSSSRSSRYPHLAQVHPQPVGRSHH